MIKRILQSVPAVLILAFAMSASAADTLESVEKAIAEKSVAHKSMQFKVTMLQDVTMEEMKTKSTSESTMEYLQRGNTWNYRMESKTVSVQQPKGQPEQKTEGKMLSVCDGQFVYTLTESNGQKSAMKMKIDPLQNTADAKVLFDALHKDNNVKLLPDETVDGKAVYVIEATPKKPEENSFCAKSLYYYQKDTGIAVKYAAYDKAGKPVITWTVNDIRLDADVPADRFVFKAPEGVQVMDMTQQTQDTTAANTQAEPQKEAEQSNQTAKQEEKKEQTPAEEQKPDQEKKKESKGAKGLLNKLKIK